MATAKHIMNPFIPRPQAKEAPVKEELVQPPLEHVDTRPQMIKRTQYVRVPHFNDLYDSLGTKGGWRFICDDIVQGTVTTVAASAVLSAVALSSPASMSPKFSLERWPGGVQVYLCVRSFSFGPSTASFITQGEINVLFIDQFGNSLPLGIVPNNNFTQFGTSSILPTPITDPANVNVGNLSFTLNSGATVGSYAWQLGFSFAYLLPAKKGYTWEIKHYDESSNI
jgi:hypothetical protein